jgi:hypothetical protein
VPDFDANTFLNVAEELLTADRNVPSSWIRTAGNRIYYSQYATLRRLITTKVSDCFLIIRSKGPPKPTGKHSQLSTACVNSPDAHIREIGVRLRSLNILRNESDYTWEASKEPTYDRVATALGTAENLRDRIAKLTIADLRQIHARIKSMG